MTKKKKRKKYRKLQPGEWAYLRTRGHGIECCDCGLRHKLDFIIMNRKGDIINNLQLAFRAYRTKK